MARVVFAQAQAPEPKAADNSPEATRPEQVPDGILERPGTKIGHYKLLEKIGEGGFGMVYMAEQVEPVQRKVALKIVKAGMDTREFIVRFEAERQALALMDHPNIARVLDAGATETGRPYFVMELVRGIPITDYCDQAQLATDERLRLFNQVCHAVQHAHQKGVIHRDLKPSNVMVTLHDGEPVPKVIDFGVAKALGQKLTEKTLFTAFQHLIGTPAYMSPEQAELSGLDVDTRSDIYSLGVLLYELLTGVTPFPKETLARAALDEVRRLIRETEPLKPSTRLRTLGDKLPELAIRRHTEPKTLGRLIQGDLDWIVMKCLEKNRARRYETANALAADIEHHLKEEPVQAAAPRAWYRASKFVRRHRTGLAAAVVLVLLMAAGTIVSTWQAVRATRAEHHAQAEAGKRQQVAQFLKDMLEGVGPSVAQGRDTTLLREILDKTAQRLGTDLPGQPEVEAELRDIIGSVYLDLDQYAEAEAMYQRSLDLRRKLHGNDSVEVALSLTYLANVRWRQGRYPEAESLLRQALAIRRKALGEENAAVANSLNDLGLLLKEQGRLAEAETALRQSLAMEEKCLPKDDPNTASTLNNLASVYWKLGRFAEAEARQRQALEMQRKQLGSEHPNVVVSINNLSTILQDQGKLADAEALQREALALTRKLVGDNHSDVARGLNNLAMVLRDQGKLAEAETAQREALAIQRQALGDEHPSVAQSLCNVGALLWDQGRFAEAENLQRQALELRRKLLGNEHPDVAQSLNALSLVLRDEGRLAEAETVQQQALEMRRKLLGAEHPYVAGSINNLGTILQAGGKLQEAETRYREALALRTKVFGQEHRDVASSLNSLGLVLREEAKLVEAESTHRQALEMRRKLLGPEHPDVAHSLHNLARVLLDAGRPDAAEPLAHEGLALREKSRPDDWRTASTRCLLGASLAGQGKYAEAETLLLSGCNALAQRQDRIPAADKVCLNDAIERLAQLYEVTSRPDKAAEWRQKLTQPGKL